MKPYTIEQIGNQPIILLTVAADYDVQHDMPHSRAELVRILDAIDEPSFYILDLSNLSVSFEDVIRAASLGARGEGASWHHPKLRDSLWVSNARLIKAAAEGLNSDTFGHLNIKFFSSADDAIKYALDQIENG